MIRQLIITLWLVTVISCMKTIRGFVNVTDAEVQVFPFDNNKHTVHKVQVLQNGVFEIPLIEKTSYMVKIESPTFHVAPNRFRVDYEEDGNEKIWQLDFGDEFAAISDLNRIPLINVTNRQRRVFVEKRNKLLWESGIILYLIENPVYLLVGVVVLMISTFPLVLSYIDPDFDEKIKQD